MTFSGDSDHLFWNARIIKFQRDLLKRPYFQNICKYKYGFSCCVFILWIICSIWQLKDKILYDDKVKFSGFLQLATLKLFKQTVWKGLVSWKKYFSTVFLEILRFNDIIHWYVHQATLPESLSSIFNISLRLRPREEIEVSSEKVFRC